MLQWWHNKSPAHARLPPQKERDLELAARIGQTLLKQNKALTERNKLLDEQLEITKEEVIIAKKKCFRWFKKE